MTEITITKEYLRSNPYHIFVFGDNLERIGNGGAAILRDLPNTYGFITKKTPDHKPTSYYKVDEYEPVFYKEINKLRKIMLDNPDYTYLISRLGAGLANKYEIYEKIIQPKIKKLLEDIPNCKFLWNDEAGEYVGYVDLTLKIHIKEYVDDMDIEKLKNLTTVADVKGPYWFESKESAIKYFQEVFHA